MSAIGDGGGFYQDLIKAYENAMSSRSNKEWDSDDSKGKENISRRKQFKTKPQTDGFLRRRLTLSVLWE
ncbi:MAG: hypothetical protein DLM72_13430 [Candidatus Nitrosopolaris wilkensis]|nr:MAG: hypothetical protein DLM72_13430 [Candidatus Nitrosopolaris wilkensis]